MYLIYIKKKHNILQLNIVLDEYCFLVSSRVQNSSTRKMPSAQKSSNTKQLPSIKKSRVGTRQMPSSRKSRSSTRTRLEEFSKVEYPPNSNLIV